MSGAGGLRGPRASPWCLRCLSHLGKPSEEECDAVAGPLGKTCSRCATSKHACEPVEDHTLLGLVQRVCRTRARTAEHLAKEEELDLVVPAIRRRLERQERVRTSEVRGALKRLSARGGKHVSSMLVKGGDGLARADLLVKQQIARSLAALVELGIARGEADQLDLTKVLAVWGEEEEESRGESSSEEEEDEGE